MRLIDADVLKSFLLDIESTTKDKKVNDTVNLVLHDAMIKFIDEQPTAYDIDMVVAELETAREDYFDDYQSAVVYGLTLAIEIIMRGYEDNERL